MHHKMADFQQQTVRFLKYKKMADLRLLQNGHFIFYCIWRYQNGRNNFLVRLGLPPSGLFAPLRTNFGHKVHLACNRFHQFVSTLQVFLRPVDECFRNGDCNRMEHDKTFLQ